MSESEGVQTAPQVMTVTIDADFVKAIADLGAHREIVEQVAIALAEEIDPEKLCMRLLRVVGRLAPYDEPTADECPLLASVRAQRRVAASVDVMAQTQLKRHHSVDWRA